MQCSEDGRDAGHIVVRMGEMLMQCSGDGRDAECSVMRMGEMLRHSVMRIV